MPCWGVGEGLDEGLGNILSCESERSVFPFLVPAKPDEAMREKLGERGDDIGMDEPEEGHSLPQGLVRERWAKEDHSSAPSSRSC